MENEKISSVSRKVTCPCPASAAGVPGKCCVLFVCIQFCIRRKRTRDTSWHWLMALIALRQSVAFDACASHFICMDLFDAADVLSACNVPGASVASGNSSRLERRLPKWPFKYGGGHVAQCCKVPSIPSGGFRRPDECRSQCRQR